MTIDFNHYKNVTLLALITITIFFTLAICGNCRAETVDMHAIMLIESGGNPYAVNYETGCYGLYQISEICLEDINNMKQSWYSIDDLFNPEINRYIARWYLLERLPQLLKHYKIPVNETTLIASYNWGIGNVVKWHNAGGKWWELPKETQNYISKYHKLAKSK